MLIHRLAGIVIVCLALFAFGISAPAKAEPDAPYVDAVVQNCTEEKFDEALAIVQAGAGGTLTFLQSCPAPIIFTSQKFIYKNVTIDGGNKVTLSGGNATRHFSLEADSRLTLKNIILTRGRAINDSGGSVFVNPGSTLFTDNVILELNVADLAGGAIHGYDAITLNNTTVQSNTASNTTWDYGAVNSTGPLTITNSFLRGNSAAKYGGAISASGKALIENTILFSNTAVSGSAIYYIGAAGLTLSNSSVRNNAGNAIDNDTKMTILGSTLSNNGTGLLTSGAATLINATFSNNERGINVYGLASLQHVTIYGSVQYGIYFPGQPASLDVIDVVIQGPVNAPTSSKNCDFQPQSVVTSHG